MGNLDRQPLMSFSFFHSRNSPFVIFLIVKQSLIAYKLLAKFLSVVGSKAMIKFNSKR